MNEWIKASVAESVRVKQALLSDEKTLDKIAAVAELLVRTYRAGGKTLWAGNGGSAADAQHMAAELVNKFRFDRRGLPAVALTANTSVVTAVGNDYGYDRLFVKQLEAFGAPGDVFIGISTSGRSANLLAVTEYCRAHGIVTVALTGAAPCGMDAYDHVIKVPSTDTPRIQECQTLIGHILCERVEKALFATE